MAFIVSPLNFTLYGPLQIHGYGCAILIGVLLSAGCTYRHLKRFVPHVTYDAFSSGLATAILAGILGGRLLHIFSEHIYYHSFFDYIAVWRGGFSILGTVIALLLAIPFILRERRIPFFPTLDIVALYAPLAHACGRIGCLFAGCCFGVQTMVPWAISYRGAPVEAPINISIHPTQLYSSLAFLVLFFLLYCVHRNYFFAFRRPGIMLLLYIIGMCLERFAIDFFRGDRLMGGWPLFSTHQWMALTLAACALLFMGIYVLIVKLKQPSSSDSIRMPNIF